MTVAASAVSVDGRDADDVRRCEEAGRTARSEKMMVDQLVAKMRLASFRTYLCATVWTKSAIAPDVLGLAGCDAASALQRIRPCQRWPESTQPQPSGRALFIRTNQKVGFSNAAQRHRDAVIADGLKDWIEAAIVGCSLEGVFRSSGFELSTRDGCARLKLKSLPDTILAACLGRSLDEVVDHPLLRDRGYVITRTNQLASEPMLEFDVGRLRLEMPWRP